ncbi:MAG: glycosyltransferase family protein [Lachnospiraceae bacterium]|nr:glycosyltransferase family protein [Lachnospiraceae bacterium]
MNDKKICFITCVNNHDFYSECLLYIDRLYIPEGYEIEVLSIEDAKSMTGGYNEGMNSTDAKYKIYLHQDVFIVDRYFLYELLDIFTNNTDIGMVGIVGAEKMSEDGCMWNKREVGSMYMLDLSDTSRCEEYTRLGSYVCDPVEVIDGLLMATQYDIRWREDIFTEFDFYDASQSMEFRKRGYKVVVPLMEKPICVHDDGFILNLINYDNNRKKYLNEYKKMLFS